MGKSLPVSMPLIVLIIASLFGLYHCAGGIDLDLLMQEEEEELSTPPTVTLLTDAAGTTIVMIGSEDVFPTSEDIFPTSFTIAFDQAMDETSVTTEGNITLTCDMPSGLEQPVITVERADDEGKEYLITVTDAYKYQLNYCVLKVTDDITNAEGTALAQDTYFFPNACAISDDFNAVSESCWTVNATEFGTIETEWQSWPGILDTGQVLEFDEANSALVYDDTRNNVTEQRLLSFSKTVDISEEGFEMTFHISSAYGLSAAVGLKDRVFVGIYKQSSYERYVIGISAVAGEQYCAAAWVNISLKKVAWYVLGTKCDASDHYMRLTYTGDSVTSEYSADGENWSSFEEKLFGVAASMPVIENLNGPGTLGVSTAAGEVGGEEGSPRNNQASIESIVTTGLSMSDQY